MAQFARCKLQRHGYQVPEPCPSSLPRNRFRNNILSLARSALSTGGAVSVDLAGWVFWRCLRNRYAVDSQQPPQASISFAQTNVFLRCFEWK